MKKEEKRELAAQRYIKSIDNNRSNYKGYFIQEDKQCFCDGYSGVILNNKINNIEEAPNRKYERLNIRDVFKEYDDIEIYETISIDEIRKNKFKIDNKCFTKISGNKFIYKRVITIIGILGKNIKAYTKTNKYDVLARKCLFLENENGKAIILCNDKYTCRG